MIAKKLKSSRKFRVFLIALLLSAFLWFINHLTREFNVNVNIDLHVKNIPEYYHTANFPDTSLQIEISGSGFGLIRYYLKDKTIVDLDFNQFSQQDAEDKHIFYIQKVDIVSAIQKELPGSITIREFDYSNISYSLTAYPTKKIPVITNLSYSCAEGYMVLGDILINPDSVLLEGPSKTIQTIDSILCAPVSLDNLEDTTKINVKLQMNEKDEWMFSRNTTDVVIPVTKVKRLTWTESFQTEVNGKLYSENIVFEAWVPVYVNKVQTRIRHKTSEKEIIFRPQLNTPSRLISFSPVSIPLDK